MIINTTLVAEQIIKWLTDYATNIGKSGYVIGVSGGIDSATVSTLCAMTGLKTIVVGMPIHQKQDQKQLSDLHMDMLCEKYSNVTKLQFDLTPSYDEFTKVVSLGSGDIGMLACGNTRSRFRMMTLYHLATTNNLLVAGTGNKVEDYGVGFFTKYGDGGVDLSPIGELTKSEVYQLGKYLSVSDEILSARPTDGLWDDGRTDEDQIGATYDELEWAMDYYDKNNKDIFDVNGESSTGLTERQSQVIGIYINRHLVNAHKMSMPPVCNIKKAKKVQKT